jgi:hypothetical protein
MPRPLEIEDRPVVVCGAGAAGIAASLAVARRGQRALLVEAGAHVGGTVAHSFIHTLGGLYDSEGEFLHEGLPTELATTLLARVPGARRRRMGRLWVLSVCPLGYREVISDTIAREPGISLLTGTSVVRADREGRRIRRLILATPSGTASVSDPRAVTDATGSGEVARLTGGEALRRTRGRPAAAGLVFVLRNVRSGVLDFPRGLGVLRSIRDAATAGELPPRCRFAWLDMGTRDDEVYVKLFVPLRADPREPLARADSFREALTERDAIAAFLRHEDGFQDASVALTGELGIRDGGQVVGEYTLTEDDVRRTTKFPDAACKCTWPIEYWDPEEGVSLEYLPRREYYEIPLRSLRVKGIDNLWAAGKDLSADAKAQASARVVGSCWAMGEAVGREIVALR